MPDRRNDEGLPVSSPSVNADPTSAKSPVPSQDATGSSTSNTGDSGVPQHITLPRDLTSTWAATVMLSPPGRAVVVDGLDCQRWTAEALHTLAARLCSRHVDIVMTDAALTFWLRSDMTAVRGCAA